MIDLIGYTYSFLFASCYIPQTIKLYKTKDCKGLSILMYWACFIAYILAIIYTILKVGYDKILLLNYGSGGFFCGILIVLFYYYKINEHKYISRFKVSSM